MSDYNDKNTDLSALEERVDELINTVNELKTENSNRPNKTIIYPIAILLFIVFGYLNFKRKI